SPSCRHTLTGPVLSLGSSPLRHGSGGSSVSTADPVSKRDTAAAATPGRRPNSLYCGIFGCEQITELSANVRRRLPASPGLPPKLAGGEQGGGQRSKVRGQRRGRHFFSDL